MMQRLLLVAVGAAALAAGGCVAVNEAVRGAGVSYVLLPVPAGATFPPCPQCATYGLDSSGTPGGSSSSSSASWEVQYVGLSELDVGGNVCSGSGGSCAGHYAGGALSQSARWHFSGDTAASGSRLPTTATGDVGAVWLSGAVLGSSQTAGTTCTPPGSEGTICPSVEFNASMPTLTGGPTTFATGVGPVQVNPGGVLLSVRVHNWLLDGSSAGGVRLDMAFSLTGAVFSGAEADAAASTTAQTAWNLASPTFPLRVAFLNTAQRNGASAAVRLSDDLPIGGGLSGARFSLDLPLTAQGDDVVAYIVLDPAFAPQAAPPSPPPVTAGDESSVLQGPMLIGVIIGSVIVALCICGCIICLFA